MRVNLTGYLQNVRTSADPLRYFDLTFHFNLIFFGIWCKHLMLFNAKAIQDLLDYMSRLQLPRTNSSSNKVHTDFALMGVELKFKLGFCLKSE